MDSTPPDLPPVLASLAAHVLVHVAEGDRTAIAARFARHAPSLYERLHKLYGHREDFTAWMQRLCATMGQLHAARPADLRTQDIERVAHPDWFGHESALGYCAYVDRFGGTLAGLKRRIPHLHYLGVTYLHLLPFLRMREGENDGGFAVANFE